MGTYDWRSLKSGAMECETVLESTSNSSLTGSLKDDWNAADSKTSACSWLA